MSKHICSHFKVRSPLQNEGRECYLHTYQQHMYMVKLIVVCVCNVEKAQALEHHAHPGQVYSRSELGQYMQNDTLVVIYGLCGIGGRERKDQFKHAQQSILPVSSCSDRQIQAHVSTVPARSFSSS